MKDIGTNVSIRKIIIIVFILAMLVSIGGIGYLIFTNWYSSARHTAKSIAEDINENIYNQIHTFLHIPHHVNEVNHKIIKNGILDLSNDKLRDKFFVGVLRSHSDDVYSFSFGTVNGEYYGARRNEKGVIEIMRNNADTGGNSWYYSVNEDMTAGDLVVRAGQFDPRTREWYKAAVEAQSPTLSSLYKHFIMEDLTISAAWPIYNTSGELQGVLGTHMLLTKISNFLEDSVSKYNGYAFILEKDSGYLVGNSMGIANFSELMDGTLVRFDIHEIENSDLREAYEKYSTNLDPHFFYEGKDQGLYINIKEIQMVGLNWVVVSALPEEFIITPVIQSIYMTVLLALLALLLSFIIYNIITRKLLMPVNNLMHVAEALSSGDLTRRVKIVRNDEIGRISESFNKVADKMNFLINNLEATIEERTEELHKANVTLEENRNQLQLILDSAAEAIYGINLKGECTFCNNSCIKLLGYSRPEELLGKNMHQQIHHSYPNGTTFPIDECKIFQSITQGKGFTVDDEVFWKADGSFFYVEYNSYPQWRNGKVIGGVITFMDITNRKQREQEIYYLNYHDTLTGLYNRRYFENSLQKIDNEYNLPLSIIFADINGLKITNDIFGHAAGDQLIKKSAKILMESCRENDIIARVGGDEFVIILPNTKEENAEKIISRIKSEFLDARISAIKCSISLGSDTKVRSDQPLEKIMANAENKMYKDKTMNRKTINTDIINTIIETLHSKSSREKQHSIVVSELCRQVGSALHMPKPEIAKLGRAGYLHDIGKIILDEAILSKDSLTGEEIEKMRQHSIVGYRILNLFDDTLDLAEYVYSHHERWDGTGYPRGLMEEQIPLISRVISVAEAYERVLNRGEFPIAERRRIAIETIKEGAGTRFDPQIANLFTQIMEKRLDEK